MSDKAAVALRNVSKDYKLYQRQSDRVREAFSPFGKSHHRNFHALRNINFDIQKGEILGIIGKNGSGKSTLLKIIAGVIQPSSGRCQVNGKVSALLELGAGFNPEFTGIENIRFVATISGASPSEIEEKMEQIVEFVDIGEFITQPVKSYSSGMKSRLGFAIAINLKPEILILDEVLSVGDAQFRRKCYAKMEEFFQGNQTVIYVSHDLNSVNQICSRVVLIHEGKVLRDGEPRETTKFYEKLLFDKNAEPGSAVIDAVEVENISAKEQMPLDRDELSPSDSNVIRPYFVPGLESGAQVVYEETDVEILTSKITTLDGEKVNVLVTGQKYRYSYQVRFNKTLKNISFGMKVKHKSGMDLAGSANHLAGKIIPEHHEGQTVGVEWSLKCNLLPGTYYTNAGVTQHTDEEMVFLARHVDNLVFRVIAPKNYISRGIVDLEQTLTCMLNPPSEVDNG